MIVFTLFYGANEAKRMNDDEVKSIESNINFYFETEKESVINDLLSDTKNNIDKLDNTQNVVKETCLKSINDFIGKDYENKFTYEETYKNKLNLLEKLYLTTIKSGTKEIRLLSKKDYEEVKKEFEDKYNHGNYYYIAVDLYNSKDYNEAYLNFQRITKENIYYDRAIEKSNLIIDNVMQLLEKDILSMNENIDKLSLDEKLKRYNQIDKVIKADGYNILQNNGAAAGQTVMHFHVHVIPRYEEEEGLVLEMKQNSGKELNLPVLAKTIGSELK